MFINHTNCFETQPHTFVTEASDLGLKPGTPLPRRIDTDLGNKLPFLFERTHIDYDEVAGWYYQQANGCIKLLIIND